MKDSSQARNTARLSSNKQELLKLFLQREGIIEAKPQTIPLREDLTVFPLSLAQQQFWQRVEGELASPNQVVTSAWSIVGALDDALLRQSIEKIVLRHTTLRATFAKNSSAEPIQQIVPEARFEWLVFDPGHVPPFDHQQEVARQMQEEAYHPFDLEHGPLLRATLLRFSPFQHALLLSTHLLVADQQSHALFLRELGQLYQAALTGTSLSLPPLPIHYADYAVWQRNWLNQGRGEQQLAYWTRQLADAPAVLPLPTDRPRPAVQRFRGASLAFQLPASLQQELHTFSQQEGATLFMTLLAVFQVLLARYSGTSDICVGTPVANRRLPELEPLIGFFVNTLVMRTHLGEQATLRQVVRQVREIALQAYQHQDVPFEQVVEALHPERTLSYSPLFQVLFALQTTEQSDLDLAGVQVTPLRVESQVAMFDLTLMLEEQAQGLEGVLEYDRDLFEPATMQRLSRHYQRLLEALVREPETQIWRVSLLTEAEERQLAQWNATEQPYERERLIHQLFEAQVERTPEALAVVCGSQCLSYQQLNQRANQVAHRLREWGVGAESLVGLCLERTPELLVGVLAILKAGGAYVPLDPSYPQERRLYMVADAGVQLVLTQESLCSIWPPSSDLHLLCLDQEQETWSAYPVSNPNVSLLSDQLAYMIYTSGSTGRPKGVQISHVSLLNLLFWHIHTYAITPQDRASQMASIAFDACVWEIWPYMVSGASIVFPTEDVRLAPLHLRDWLIEQRITCCFLPTPLAESILNLPWPEQIPLRHLLTGGDKLHAYPDARLPFRLVNHYGPTESTVVATAGIVPLAQSEHYGEPDIGRPITNTRAYVLDGHLQQVPLGVAGELCIESVGLARGYFKRPDLTAERFIPHPCTREPGARLYRTGDLVRYRADGTLEYLGRIDQQVKVRGFRIELGEIENVLNQSPDVESCVVLAYDDAFAQKELVAYLVPHASNASSTLISDIRQWLQIRLPDYMVPAAFVLLERLPLTHNGKIDRRALPRPHIGRDALSSGYVAPQSASERELAAIWAEILHLPQVGITDNFFLLGGHSLRATQLLTRVSSLFGVDVPIAVFFDQPTITGLVEYIQVHHGAQEQKHASPLSPVSRQQELPLSYAQQRLWFLDRLDPDNTAYTIIVAWAVRGPLRVGALQQSLQEIIQRHETLRTTFELSHEQPVQRIADRASLAFQVHTFSTFSEQEREQAVQRFLQQESQRPFELARGPLLRANLLRLAPEEYCLILALHHIVIDGWSLPLLQRELSQLYQAALTGSSLSLPPLPIHYADYAVWQRNWLNQGRGEQQLAYWTRQLADAPAVLPLPTDRPRPAVQRFRGASLTFQLPASLQQELHTFSQQEGVTLFMTLLAVFQVLLARYSGTRDICVGTPVANRRLPELEPLIGFFVNTLVMRTQLGEQATLRQVVRQVREIALQAYQHQDVPFEQVVEALHPERTLSYSPLFQVLFALQTTEQSNLELAGVQVAPLRVESQVSMFDLTLTLEEKAQGLEGVLEYDRDLFEPATMQRLSQHYQRLLEVLVREPETQIWRVSLLTEAEEQQLAQWNATEQPYERERLIHQLFEAQVERTPEALAVVCGSQCLSYQQLNQRANQVAHRLREWGVGAESLVGLCLERTPELLVGVLAILKTGGAYVPLDPSYPQERRLYMVADAGVQLVLTQEALCSIWPPSSDLHLLCLDQENYTGLPLTNPIHKTDPVNAAYLIYTSGSTGRPNGVLVPQRALVNHCTAIAQAYGLQASDRVLQFASLTFDVAAEEIFPAWLVGATVVMRSDRTSMTPDDFFQQVEQEQLSVLNLPTPYWQELVGQLAHAGTQVSPPSSLRLLVIGSDKASPEYVALWQRLMGQRIQLYNGYGPTEATITAAIAALDHVYHQEQMQPVPIGRPIANVQFHILDSHLLPVPQGIPGELYIGGDGLARGYVRNAALTAERFIPHPYSSLPGQRLYKTGDIARYLPDGNLEYMGRVDYQVKIRGFRVEPGEIEKALMQHPGIDECLVQVYEETPGDRRLAAYFVSHREALLTGGEIRDFLKERLPSYMLPSAFILLETLPLTANGKVDRRALPLPQNSRDALETAYLAPRNQREQDLAAIWAEILHQPQVGIEDNFFSLGGHSLLAVQLIARVRQVFQVDLPIRSLFEKPTIVELATEIQERLSSGSVVLPSLQPVGRDQELPLSYAQQTLWFLDRLDPGNATYNFVIVWSLRGPLRVGALQQSLQEIVQRHEALRTTFELSHEQPVQRIADHTQLAFQTHSFSAIPAQEREQAVQRFIQEESQRPFELARGPLLRASLLRLAPEEHCLILALHHIVIDGWSLPLLQRELGQLYQAALTGTSLSLPPLPIHYADYAVWQRDWLNQGGGERQLAYWIQQLADAPAVLPLPTDRPRPAVQRFRGASLTFQLPASLQQELHTFSQQEGVTLFMALLAVFQVLLARYSGTRDICVGTPVANRRLPELEPLIGFFVNTLVMRTHLGEQATLRQVVRQVREIALQAYQHQDVPFERVVEALHPERTLSYSPLFQVLFALQNTEQSNLELAGVQVSPMTVESQTAMFDLTLSLEEGAHGLEGIVEYDRDLFDPATIQRLMRHYQRLLEVLVQEPEAEIWQVQLLTAQEERQLAQWNATEQPYERERLIHQLFEAQVERMPEALAVVCGSQRLSYQQLNQRANQVAHQLIAAGIQPGALVAVYMERSLEMVVAVLGILKAGAAYVPLELSFPEARIEWILNNLKIETITTRSSRLPIMQRLQQGTALKQIVCLDSSEDETMLTSTNYQVFTHPHLDGQSVDNPNRQLPADSLAYIIFTSGSTGTPKGVMIQHRPIINLIEWMNRTFEIVPTDQVLFVTSLCFDLSVYDIFGMLAAGGSIRVALDSDLRDPEQLLRYLHHEPITIWNSAPAMLQQLVPFFTIQDPDALRRNLRLVFLSGDWIPVWLPDVLRGAFPASEVISLGGATETTVWSNFYRIGAVDPLWSSIPYGKPMQNAHYYILDARLHPCPIGVPGELYIGGECLSCGYSQDPALTARKFIPDPFSNHAGMRMYRTGDMARYWADGTIEFLGRIDTQVKIRGFRVELGEIEVVLQQHPDIEECIVNAYEAQPGQKELVAYVVPAGGRVERVEARELSEWLRMRLPSYMVPAAFVSLDALPLTSNGKIDRRALPHPQNSRDGLETAYLAPRNQRERELAVIWAEILHLPQVGIEDNFFLLGGHSLLAVQLIARIRQVFQVDLPIRSLFEKPTIAGLATEIQERAGAHLDVPPPLLPASREGALPLAFAQQRFWFLDRLEPGNPAYNVPFALRLTGNFNLEYCRQSIYTIVQRHEVLRTSIVTVQGKATQQIATQPRVPFQVHDLQHLSGEKQEEAVMSALEQEGERPFHLADYPLLRVLLIKLSQREHILMVTMHHVVTDGWSCELFIQEFYELYNALTAGRPPQLPVLPVQYADYAIWQREWFQQGALQRQLAYWKDRLAGARPLDLSHDRVMPVPALAPLAAQPVVVEAELGQDARSLSQREGVTLFMILLATFQILLAEWTGQEDIAVGTLVANRARTEVESLIGCFVNTLVLHTSMEGNQTFTELLKRVQEITLGAYSHQDTPLELVINALRAETGEQQKQFYNVMFALHTGLQSTAVQLADLTVRPIGMRSKTARVDLMLSLGEDGSEINGAIEYNGDLFTPATIERLGIRYVQLLDLVVEQPDLPLKDVLRHQRNGEQRRTRAPRMRDVGE